MSLRLGFALGLLMLASAGCGNDGSACVLDSDCASFAQVCIDGTCQDPGAAVDSGSAQRDAGDGEDMDSGVEESMDAGEEEMDAGEPTDGAPEDAEPGDADMGDAMIPTCETPPTDWMVMPVSAIEQCGNAAAGRGVTMTPTDGMPCNFTVAPTDPLMPSLAGTFDLDDANMVRGDMAPGDAMVMTCTGTYNPGGPSFTIICGPSCVMNLVAAAGP